MIKIINQFKVVFNTVGLFILISIGLFMISSISNDVSKFFLSLKSDDSVFGKFFYSVYSMFFNIGQLAAFFGISILIGLAIYYLVKLYKDNK